MGLNKPERAAGVSFPSFTTRSWQQWLNIQFKKLTRRFVTRGETANVIDQTKNDLKVKEMAPEFGLVVFCARVYR